MSKNCVSEFDRGVAHRGKGGISIKKSICVKKDQMVNSGFICLKAIKSKHSVNENEPSNPVPQAKLGISANKRALVNSRPRSEFKRDQQQFLGSEDSQIGAQSKKMTDTLADWKLEQEPINEEPKIQMVKSIDPHSSVLYAERLRKLLKS